METIERPTPTVEETPRHDRRPLIVVLVAIVALLLGALGGWLIWGSDDDAPDDAIEVGTGELTDRQQEMVRIADEHEEALRAGDAEALTALYVPQGVLTNAFGEVYRADDGTMAAMFDVHAPPTLMETLPPTLVFENVTTQVIDWGEGSANGTVLHNFTTSGEVLIISTQYGYVR